MKGKISLFVIMVLCILMSGCTSLAKMTSVKKLAEPNLDRSLVNFVRPSVFYGDAISHELWDGEKFIGTLKAGTMVQYETSPGEHVFMLDSKNRGWSFVKADLAAGKSYYLKSNMPAMGDVILGVAKSSDARVGIWNSKLTPMSIDHNQSKTLPQKVRDEAALKLDLFRRGEVKFQSMSSVNEF